uniref:Peroxidase n=1 Tax=Rhabditophanes sp. KR3021 TaxID=114890 RepID=A0AC35TMB3_9BILA
MSPFDPAEDKTETVPVYIQKFDPDRTAKSNALKMRDMNLQRVKELHKHLDDAKVGDALKKVRSKMKSGKALPSTRVISNALNEDNSPPNSNKFSHMVVQFGQFVAHDIDHVPVETTPKGPFLDCS